MGLIEIILVIWFIAFVILFSYGGDYLDNSGLFKQASNKSRTNEQKQICTSPRTFVAGISKEKFDCLLLGYDGGKNESIR